MKIRKLRLRLFGPFSAVWSDETAVEIKGTKVKALLALLATAPDGMRTRSWLQSLLWSRSGGDLGRASLRRALSDLKKSLGDDFNRVIEASNSAVSLRADAFEIMGQETDGDFLEGLSIPEPEFQKWLSDRRTNERAGTALAPPSVQTSAKRFASPSVAVIPFTFLNRTNHSDVLGDVLAQEVSRTLSRSKHFIVFSHLLGRQLGAPDTDLRSMAEASPIDFVVYGTIRANQDMLEIDADIADTQSGRLCSTHAFSVSVSDFLEGKTDLVILMARRVAETIVLRKVEQKLHSETYLNTLTGGASDTLHSLEEASAENGGLTFEDVIANQPGNSEFQTWLSRWYVEYLEFSGLEAIRYKSSERARHCFQKALEIAENIGDADDRDRTTGRLLLLLGPQLSTNHGFASTEVQEVYDKASRQYREVLGGSQQLQMVWGRWGAVIVQADISTAEQLSDEFLAIASDSSGALELSVGHYMKGVGAFYIGDFAYAEEAFLQAENLAKTVGYHDMITRFGLDIRMLAKCYLGWCYALMGRSEKTERTAHSLAIAASRSDHAFSQALSYCFLSTMHNFLGNLAQAKKFGLRAIRLCRQHGFAQQAGHARINLGRVRERAGNTSGLFLMKDGLNAYSATGAALARPYADAWISEALFDHREERGALERILKARRFTRRTGERYFDAELLRISALATFGGRPEPMRRVEKLLEMSVKQARRTGANLHLVKTLSDLDDHVYGSRVHSFAGMAARMELQDA